MKKIIRVIWTSVLAAVVAVTAAALSFAQDDGKWIAAWGTGITEVSVTDVAAWGSGSEFLGLFRDESLALFKDVTFRTVVTPSASGSKIRLKLSNVYGKTDLKIMRLTVAKSLGGSQIDKKSIKTLLQPMEKLVIPAGKEIYTEEIDMSVTAMEPIAVSMYIGEGEDLTSMGLSGAKTYFALGENATQAQTLATDIKIASFDIPLSFDRFSIVPVLSTVDVYSEEPDACSVVVVGDSTVANDFPQYLAQEINNMGFTNIGVVGKGIMGNCLLSDGTDTKMFGKSLINRFDTDVLKQAGVKYVICKIGANDILNPRSEVNIAKGVVQPNYYDLKAGYQQINEMCKFAGVDLFYIGITPWKGYDRDFTGRNAMYSYNVADWNIAKTVNNSYLAKTSAATYVNFNAISTNPLDSTMLDDRFTEDYFHPNSSLQLYWAQKFPIEKLGVSQRPTKLTINLSSAKIAAGEDVTITPLVQPSNAGNKKVVWTSEDEKIATVSSDGTVTGVAPGKTTVTCRTKVGALEESCEITVYRKVTSVKVSASSLTLYQTQTAKLKATVYPSDAENKSVKWTSSDDTVAKISSSGKITAVYPGKCTVTVKTSDGLRKDSCTVTVIEKTAVTKVGLNAKSKTLQKGGTYQLTSKIYPSNASIKTVKYTSSNKKVATVTSSGLVKAVGGGSATITCMSTDTGAYATCKISVKCAVTGVKLNKKSISLYVNKTCQLIETVSPLDATSASVTWFTDNSAVATVSHDGLVKAKKKGKTVISCITDDGGYIAQCTVTVKKFIHVDDIELNTTAKTIYVTNTYRLKPIFFPDNASDQSVKWKSSDKKIATVSSKGIVTGKKIGTCKITCTSVDGSKKAVCTLKVKGLPASGVSLNKSSAVIADGKKTTLKATVTPSNAADKSVKWSTSNAKIATVSSKGVVTAVKPGTCTVTCKTVSGGHTQKCKITVTRVHVLSVSVSKDGKNELTGTTVSAGGSITLKPIVYPSNATNKKVKWSSNDKDIATVSSKGVVKGVKQGTTFIYCTTVDGGCIAMCALKVTPKVKVTRVSVNKTNVAMMKGATVQLSATVYPSNAANKSVKWTTGNSKVATVSSSGKITAKGVGSTVITVKSVDGGYKATCSVKVVSSSTPTPTPTPGKTQHVIGVKLDKTAVAVARGKTGKLTATVLPADATNKAVTWTSSNPAVVLVDKNGTYIGLSAGTAVITVKTVDNSWKATCTVVVK